MAEARQGYYHHPTVQDQQVVFICEDDLWSVALAGGIPRRLTSNLGIVSFPRLSPDGKWLAFCGREEGQPDVYVMPAEGGEMRRLTFFGAVFKIATWTPDSESILFLSTQGARIPPDQPIVYRVSLAGEYPTRFLNCPVRNIALNPAGPGLAIGRNNYDNARWKRYRGGTAGEIWVDPDFSNENRNGRFTKLNLPEGNPNGPLWIGGRLYFASDHDGVGNLYSCTLSGKDLRRETAHRDFYVRHPATDGKTIVYQAGADLFALDAASREGRRLPIQWRSPLVQTQRKFSSAARYLENYHLHPKGHSIAITARGKLFSMAHWEGAPVQYGTREGARYRLAHWLHDGKRLVAVSDHNAGEEKLVLFSGEPTLEPERIIEAPPGRIQSLHVSPATAQAAITTSRLELWLVDLESGQQRRLDHNEFSEITGVAYSPDGRWLAYRKALAEECSAIFLCELNSGAVHQITRPVLYDFYPHFDPDGRYLYFLSARVLNPVNDNVQFAVSFPSASKPYLITLRKELANPFVPSPAAPGEESAPKLDNTKSNGKEEKSTESTNGAEKAEPKEKPVEPMRIDLEGIQHRIVEFPVKEGIHRQVLGIKDKVVFTSFPIRGRADLGDSSASDDDDEKGTLWVYDFVTQKLESIAYDVQSVQVANGGKTLSYRNGRRLRVLKAGEKPGDNSESATTRKSGWLDLDRARFAIDPRAEWRQMFREAWRLQREFFWAENMSGIDWQKVFERYYPLLERIATRTEFSDLIWEVQGELGTSHAYESGGDYRYTPYYSLGRLGAELDYKAENRHYVFAKIYRGDGWMKDCASPLCMPGLNISEGDALLAISGVPLNATTTPGQLLTNLAGQEVVLTVQSAQPGSAPRNVTVKTLRDESKARYRDWVERNMQRVAEATADRVGYLHIPDMGTEGLIEFHRYYLAQTHKAGLIVDVRYNGGGNVSQILLEKLIRRPLGYDVRRWGTPQPYPSHAMGGPIVALTNEFAGSDGDIFCHSFKLLKIGPLIGKRTWGGVIGIDHRYTLVDGGRTTQPQYSFWFTDVHWRVENYGVDPDIVVDFDPDSHLRGEDPQLERAIVEAKRLLAENGVAPPKFDGRPNLALPE